MSSFERMAINLAKRFLTGVIRMFSAALRAVEVVVAIWCRLIYGTPINIENSDQLPIMVQRILEGLS